MRWAPLPYEAWSATCDTLHAHAQVLGKLAVALAPPEPELQHAALRLSGRGWETLPLPAPDGSGALVVTLDLHTHDAVVEHTDGRAQRIPLAPDRPVADDTRDLLAAVGDLVGPVQIDPTPQETPWSTPLDEDFEHATYDPTQVTTYFAAATQAALAARSGSQPHTMQACRIAERPKSSAARCGSRATRTSSQLRMYSPSSASQCAAGGDSVAVSNPSGGGNA